MAGRFDVPAQPGTDSLVLKVTPNVSYAWAAGLDIGARESFDTIAADSYGNVWVAGQAGGTFTVMGLEPAGYSLGSTTRSGPLLSKDTARAAVCRAGALYVAGWTRIGDAESEALRMRLTCGSASARAPARPQDGFARSGSRWQTGYKPYLHGDNARE